MAGLPLLHGAEAAAAGPLRRLVNRFAEVTFALSAQSTACNRLHPVEERLARWLLMTQDRVGAEELSLTQQILPEMLGVRRASVTTAAGVLDRAGLEAAACECYRVVWTQF